MLGFGIPAEYGGPGPTSYRFPAVIDEETARTAVWLGHLRACTVSRPTSYCGGTRWLREGLPRRWFQA